jgi:RNA polymerase-binding transcription factor DksA
MEGISTMKAYKVVMRRSILTLLVDHLRVSCDLDFPEGSGVIDVITNSEIDALLSFRSDPKLDELRGALTRLDNGTFGICIGCKNRIDRSFLVREPDKRLCPDCEQRFRNPILDASLSALLTSENNFSEEL